MGILVGVTTLGLIGCLDQKPGAGKAAFSGELKSQKDKVSYSIGLDIGKSFKQQAIDVDMAILEKGITDAMSGEKALLTDEQVRETMMAFQQEMMQKQDSISKAKSSENNQAEEEFFAKNGQVEGVVTLPSGLQYKVNQAGSGAKPSASDQVTVHYRGTLLDGTEFDSSESHGGPATFPVSGVIPGWTEALQLMEPGAKWTIYVPSKLAYGERGAGAKIGPDAALIFDVELVKVN